MLKRGEGMMKSKKAGEEKYNGNSIFYPTWTDCLECREQDMWCNRFTTHRFSHEQAIELGKKILAEGIQIDEILYSPLIRAKATALHVSEITGIPAREEIRLKEQNFGKYESTPRDGEEFAKAKCNLYVVLMEERQCFILHSVYIICLMI